MTADSLTWRVIHWSKLPKLKGTTVSAFALDIAIIANATNNKDFFIFLVVNYINIGLIFSVCCFAKQMMSYFAVYALAGVAVAAFELD